VYRVHEISLAVAQFGQALRQGAFAFLGIVRAGLRERIFVECLRELDKR
jgi:hypothetical protein